MNLTLRKRLVFGLFVVAMSVGFADVLVQFAVTKVPRINYHVSHPLTRNVIPDRTLGYRMSPYFRGHDQRGYRNDSALVRYDIVALGDSLTYGLGALADGTWPRHLERSSGKSVYNAGVGGYGPCEYLGSVDELLALKPTLVIVGLYVGNDVGNAWASVYVQKRCPSFATHDFRVLGAMREADLNSQTNLRKLAAEFGETAVAPPTPSVFERSALYRLGRSLYYEFETRNLLPNREGRADSFEAAARLPLRVAMDPPSGFRTVFRDPRLDILAVDLDDTRMVEGLRVTLAALDAIRVTAAAAGSDVLVAIIHSKPFVLAPVIRDQRQDLWPKFERLVSLETAVTERLSSGLSVQQIRFVDTGAALRESVAGGLMPFHDSDDTHPNTRGYQVIAETIRLAIGR